MRKKCKEFDRSADDAIDDVHDGRAAIMSQNIFESIL
jgi:hypothetical protein